MTDRRHVEIDRGDADERNGSPRGLKPGLFAALRLGLVVVLVLAASVGVAYVSASAAWRASMPIGDAINELAWSPDSTIPDSDPEAERNWPRFVTKGWWADSALPDLNGHPETLPAPDWSVVSVFLWLLLIGPISGLLIGVLLGRARRWTRAAALLSLPVLSGLLLLALFLAHQIPSLGYLYSVDRLAMVTYTQHIGWLGYALGNGTVLVSYWLVGRAVHRRLRPDLATMVQPSSG